MPKFSCFIIGETTLLIQCAKILLRRGHEIYGIISPDATVNDWARANNLLCAEPAADLVAFMSRPFDYLFSIVNWRILPKEVLALPRRYPINYHDAPLPKYAGAHATSWAIMQRETDHAVTWHVVTNLVDAGDILKQRPIPLAPHETAFTLNAKCYDAAITSFTELVEELSSGQASPIKQDLARRAYFPLYQRPAAGAVLSWNQTAHDIDALARSLDFGPYPNPLGLPKIAVAQEFIIAPKVETLTSRCGVPPGTITAIEPDSIKVATTTYDLAFHHILTIDGQSLSIPDVVARLKLGQGSRLAELAPDTAQRLTRLNETLCQHEPFWVERLADLQPVSLPYARRGPLKQTKQTPKVLTPLSIPEEVAAFAQTWPRGELLLAAFAVYLARVGGSGCFDFGFRDARLRRDLAGLTGFFAPLAPLRVNIGYEQSFADIFDILQAETALVRCRQSYARDIIARYPTLSSSPKTVASPLAWPVIVEQGIDPDNDAPLPGAELTLALAPDESRLAGYWLYDPEILAEESVKTIDHQFMALLQAIARNPRQPIVDLPLLSDEERRHLLVDLAGSDLPAMDYPRQRCLHQLFEAQAGRAPEAVAVRFADQQLTYHELNGRANQLAHYLQARGVGPEVVVGIYVERSLEMMVGLLGILKAGGAYLPLEPAYPQRLAFMLEDSGVSILLTQARLRPGLPEHQAEVVYLDSDWDLISRESAANPVSPVEPENLAYVIYTSGSTGRPKGVQICHRSVVHLLETTRPLFDFNEEDVWTVFHSYAFDFSVWEIWMPLGCGSRLVIVPTQAIQSPTLFYDLLRAEQVTVLNQTPSAMRQLIHAQKETPPTGLALRLIVCGGETFPGEMLPALLEWNAPVWNFYGPTEATVWAAIHQAKAADAFLASIPIGRPLPDTQLYILDSRLQPVPIGVPGELYIGGAGLARGYLNRPDLTAETFIPNPFGGIKAEGGRRKDENGLSSSFIPHPSSLNPHPPSLLYKTGDLARYLADGVIEFLGRLDHQVKIRGFRVELGEIEAVLHQHPAVREGVVLAREDIPAEKRLVAYIVPGQSPAPTASELRAFLQDRLPDYMLPSAFVMLDAMPMTANKKLDRHALPPPGRSRPPLSGGFAPPRTIVEELLAGWWADLLGLEPIGAHDNFFELGGHSLLATQLVSRLRDTFQVEVSLSTLFETPTVSGLGNALMLLRQRSVNAPPILPVSAAEALPLSFAQQRLWFLHQLDPASAAYNVPTAIRLSGPLQVDALAHSLNQLAQRHAALRTTFTVVNGEPAQRIAPTLTLPLPVVDLSQLPAAEREIEAHRLATAESRQPFDLGRGPLWRTTLLRLAEQEHIFLLTLHHLVSDGWSRKIMFQDLSTLYRACAAGQPSPLANLPLQYADFALWQRQWLAARPESDDFPLRPQLDYWRQQLDDLPTLQLPTDRPRPTTQTFRGATYTFVLPGSLAESLRVLSQQEGVTLFMTLLAAFQTLLHRYTSQLDIPVGSPIANRRHREVENLIGFFVNTLVLRADLSGNPTFRELLARVRQVALDAYAQQDLPFDQLVEVLQPERDPGRHPLFQVMFSWQNEPPLQALALPGLTAAWLPVDPGAAQFDLSLELIQESEGLSGAFEYNTDLFDPPTIARLAGHFQMLLKGIVARPDERLSDLPLLSQVERHQLLVEWNGLASYISPPARCLHKLFESQAERTPAAVAVICLGHQAPELTYRELNRRANQLAHYLQKLGVGPETPVGLCFERSPEMVVSLLGILKAGGAYLPLDPDYPPERLAFMLADTQAPILLTQQQIAAKIENLTSKIAPLRVICLDTAGAVIARESVENPMSGATAENLAYIMYTSGSTGQPKGVMIEHHSLAWYAKTATAMYGLTANDRVLQFAPISFDISVEEIYPCLTCGATLALRAEEIAGSIPAFLEACRQGGITALFLPTAFWHELATGLANEPWRLPASLRLVSFGGEKVLPERVAAWRRAIGNRVQLMNGYGPTETTVVATLCQLSDTAEAAAWSASSIGRVIPGAQVYILDQNLQPAPVGVPGELHIGGEGVARGYLNQPKLTAARFIHNPFTGDEGGRMKAEDGEINFILHPSLFSPLPSPFPRLYKTGDMARYRSDGTIEYLGRFDQQVKIRGFRVELAEIEAILAQHPQVREALVIAQADKAGHNRLVAYIVPAQSPSATQPLTFKRDLHHFLKGKLPEYMLPAALALLEALPLTPNGKVDRRALPAVDLSDSAPVESFVAPRNRVEQILAELWGQALGFERVGIDDNFFELGGDSILSLQLIARANQAGLRLTPRQIFERQTIAGLAEVVDTAVVIEAEQGPVTGPLPLTPIQCWFFEQNFAAPHHWNMPVLFELEPSPEPTLVAQAIHHLLCHHDALRLRFGRYDPAGWQQINADLEEDASVVPLIETDVSTLSTPEQEAAIRAVAEELQAGLNLSTGPLLRAALFQLGPQKAAGLLIVVHHLAVDGVSWRILREDLQMAYRQLAQSEPLRLPAKTTSFKQWAELLSEYAQSDALRAEAAYWLNELPAQAARLPIDYPPAENTEASARVASASLDIEATHALLHQVPALYRSQVNEILLAGLALTLARWLAARGMDLKPLLIDLEGHGREEIGPGLDLSRTVGWFTTLFPVSLRLAVDASPEQAIQLVQQTLARIPRRGLGYGLLRYLNGEADLAAQLRALPQAEVSFNYLGQFEQAPPAGDFRLLPLSTTRRLTGPARGPANHRSHPLEVDCYIADGHLYVDWTYSELAHQQTTIAALADSFTTILRSLIAAGQAGQGRRYMPLDFPLARLDRPTIEQWVNNPSIEDIYPLSPLQQAMLAYTQAAPGSSVYRVQWACTLHGHLDIAAFRRAWQRVVERHPMLRTAFMWQGLAEPLQVVHQQASLPWEYHNWQEMSLTQQQVKLAELLQADHARGFDLTSPPLMRLTLIQTGAKTCEFIWNHHHLLLDGWSTYPLWRDVFTFYEAFCRGEIPPATLPAPPYRAYIAWLRELETLKVSKTFRVWKPQNDLLRPADYDEQQLRLSPDTTSRLQSFAQQHHLTLNSVTQGVWALLLRYYTGRDRVTFWTVVSDRPTAADFEMMVGLLINILPAPVDISPAMPLIPWLTRLQQQQVELRQQREHDPPFILSPGERENFNPLFESLLRFQNYPVSPVLTGEEVAPKSGRRPEIRNTRWIDRWPYPLNVEVIPGSRLLLQISYQQNSFKKETIQQILNRFQRLLEAFMVNSQQSLAALLGLLETEGT
ncbi:MAG: amino acid adenylation domain-containing protein [Anaerolineae bacterium]|nr:amino acid adenylation domain-containing protein [Anaerolineae bacterium]